MSATATPNSTPTRTGMPPRPDLSSFMMNAGFMLTPTKFMQACHERCGDYFTLRPTPDREVVFTVDPAAVKKVFKGDPNLLYAGEGNVALAPLLGSGSVLLLDGPEHLRHRKLMLPAFHGDRMRAYGETMAEVAERHIAGWPRGRSFPVLPSMQAITLEIIMRAVFGFDDRERRERIGDPLRRLLDTVGTRPRVMVMALTAGRYGPLSPWRRFAAIRAEADALLRAEIRSRRADLDGIEGDDVFSMLLAARDPEGRPMTEDELTDELMTLLVAGHETTATALSWTLERLIRSPDVLAKLLAEQDAGRSEYLEAVIKESLRIRPVVPGVARRLQAPMEFGGWHLPAGATIAPSIYLLHRRPDLYPEPEQFRPERFLGEDAPGTYEWIPFGGGVRRCLGASFALFEMRIVLATVLEQVRLGSDRSLRPESVNRRAITFAPARGARVVATDD